MREKTQAQVGERKITVEERHLVYLRNKLPGPDFFFSLGLLYLRHNVDQPFSCKHQQGGLWGHHENRFVIRWLTGSQRGLLSVGQMFLIRATTRRGSCFIQKTTFMCRLSYTDMENLRCRVGNNSLKMVFLYITLDTQDAVFVLTIIVFPRWGMHVVL